MSCEIFDVTSTLEDIREWPEFGRHYPSGLTTFSGDYVLYTIFSTLAYRIHWKRSLFGTPDSRVVTLSLAVYEDYNDHDKTSSTWKVIWTDSLPEAEANVQVTDLMERLESYVVASVL